MQRDWWLERLLQAIQFMCSPADSKQNDGNEKSVLMEAALVIRVVQIMYNRMKKLQM